MIGVKSLFLTNEHKKHRQRQDILNSIHGFCVTCVLPGKRIAEQLLRKRGIYPLL